MKHKTWFRLVIKAIGVLLVGLSFSDFVTGIIRFLSSLEFYSQVVAMRSTAQLIVSPDFYAYLLSPLPGVVPFAFGLYLFFCGKWIVNRCIPSNRPYCPECGYDLSKSKSVRCSECGADVGHLRLGEAEASDRASAPRDEAAP